jgi:hypothetical protein
VVRMPVMAKSEACVPFQTAHMCAICQRRTQGSHFKSGPWAAFQMLHMCNICHPRTPCVRFQMLCMRSFSNRCERFATVMAAGAAVHARARCAAASPRARPAERRRCSVKHGRRRSQPSRSTRLPRRRPGVIQRSYSKAGPFHHGRGGSRRPASTPYSPC